MPQPRSSDHGQRGGRRMGAALAHPTWMAAASRRRQLPRHLGRERARDQSRRAGGLAGTAAMLRRGSSARTRRRAARPRRQRRTRLRDAEQQECAAGAGRTRRRGQRRAGHLERIGMGMAERRATRAQPTVPQRMPGSARPTAATATSARHRRAIDDGTEGRFRRCEEYRPRAPRAPAPHRASRRTTIGSRIKATDRAASPTRHHRPAPMEARRPAPDRPQPRRR